MKIPVEIENFWREWAPKIPFIQFPADWKVAIMPSFNGALIRYCVKKSASKLVCVYLTVDDSLGPHWGVFSYDEDDDFDGEIERCAMDNINELLRLIDQAGKEAASPKYEGEKE